MNTAEQNAGRQGPINVLVLCVYQEMGDTFVQAVTEGKPGPVTIGSHTANIEVLAGDPRVNPVWDEAIRKADALALIVRFMDVISFEKIKAIFRRIPKENSQPLAILLYREEGEIDFKMSCPACGQKLWVRDSDVGKRGRCPNCKKAFKLPSQAGHLKSRLMLPDAVPTITVVRGKPASCRGALASLMSYLAGTIVSKTGSLDQETLKKTTVRVQLSDSES